MAPGESNLERTFDTLLKQVGGCPAPVKEYRYAKPRRWRFDRAWPEQKVAVELDGGVYTQGRHTRGAGYEKDCEKLTTSSEL